MIKINIENIEYIKSEHGKYIEEYVKSKIDLFYMFNLSENEVANFIVNILGKDLYKITLEKWNFEYIRQIDREYQKIKDKKITDYINEKYIQIALDKMENYLKSINKKDNKGANKGKREGRWKDTVENIKKNTFEQIDLAIFNNENINWNNKVEIEKFIKPISKFLKDKIKDKNGDYLTLKNIINKIFSYDDFSNDKDSSWGRNKLLYYMNIESCPYCNINYIGNYMKSGNEKTTADLDHFLCKDKYPYLALSLYNFIPSCTICNSRFKIDKDFLIESNLHTFPNEEGFGKDAIFTTSFNQNSDVDYLLGNSLNFDINIDIKTKDDVKIKKIQNSIKTFRLSERYSEQKEFVKDIIKSINMYNDSEIIQMLEIKGLFESEEELKKLIFGFDLNEKNLYKKPFSKLALDIFEEFTLGC